MADNNIIKQINRGNQIRRDDSVKDLYVNLYDIDSVIKYYFDNVIQPTVMEGDEQVIVPVMYGSPERWKSVQKSGVYRDKKGKIQFPLVIYKRTSVEKNKSLGSKVDTTNPLFASFRKNYTEKNKYDNFNVLNNRQPVKQLHNVVIPDYVKLSYSCIIFTEYLEQLNKIVEDINYAAGQYWGQDEKFKFLSTIDSFDIESAAEQGQDRLSKANFTLNMHGFIIPDNIQKAMSNYNPKDFGKVKIEIAAETVKTFDDLNSNSEKEEKEFRDAKKDYIDKNRK
tara:strand:- start:541 stop:1383 length:843 start_codon:yes stop_codon:yes gene_type:complete